MQDSAFTLFFGRTQERNSEEWRWVGSFYEWMVIVGWNGRWAERSQRSLRLSCLGMNLPFPRGGPGQRRIKELSLSTRIVTQPVTVGEPSLVLGLVCRTRRCYIIRSRSYRRKKQSLFVSNYFWGVGNSHSNLHWIRKGKPYNSKSRDSCSSSFSSSRKRTKGMPVKQKHFHSIQSPPTAICTATTTYFPFFLAQ